MWCNIKVFDELNKSIGQGKKCFINDTLNTFSYDYMASDIWQRTMKIAREETRRMGYTLRLAARVLLYAPSHRQDSTQHGLWYTSRGTWLE